MHKWLVCVALVGCAAETTADQTQAAKIDKTSKKCHPHKKHNDCGTATATIGVAGGTIQTGTGATVQVPYGAVDSDTTITVNTTDMTAPGSTAPVFEFLPEGTVFAKPLTVTLDVPAGLTHPTVYWTQLGSTTAYDAIGGTVSGTQITAQTFHFSLAYVGDGTGLRTVEGGGSTTWISASGRTSVKTDFSTTPVEIIYGDGSGGFVTRQAAPDGLGLFKLDNVPGGEYIVHSGMTWLVTSASLPDLGRTMGGRPDTDRRFFQPGESSLITLNLSNLTTWTTGDMLEWFSTEPDDWDFDSERLATFPTPTSAQLAIDVAQVDGTTLGPAEIHAAQGDQATVGQLVTSMTAANTPYVAMQRIAHFPSGFSAVAGQTQTIDLALTDVSTANTLSIDYRGSQWRAALDTYGNPTATCDAGDPSCGGFAGALGQAGGNGDGFYTANADMLLMWDSAGQDIVSGPMPYADPAQLGGTWGVLFDARWSRRSHVQIPNTVGLGGRANFGFANGVEWTTDVATAQAAPIVPQLLPPTNVTVNGTAFFSGGGDVGASPTLSWTNPNTGAIQPAFYTINVFDIFIDAQNRTHAGRPIATINTPDMSITLPPGITQAGHDYVFTITATAPTSAAASSTLATSPFKSSIDIASASVSSGLFGTLAGTPPPPAAQIIQGGQNYPLGTAANSTNVFWVERGQAPWDPPTARNAGNVWTANLDGTNAHVLATGQDEPFGIAATDTTIYWTNQADGGFQTGAVMAMDLASGTITQVTVATNPGDIDAFGGDIYWVSGEGTSRLHAGAITSVTGESGVTLDIDSANVYLANYGAGPPSATGTVDQVPLAGGTTTTLASGQPQTFDVHSDGAYVYWSNQAWQQTGLSTINRTPVGGGPIDTLVTGNELQKYFAIDASNIYFARDNAVWSVPKAGGAATAIASLPDTYGCPQAELTIAAGSLYFTDTCSGMATYRVVLP